MSTKPHDWTHDGLLADLASYLRCPDRMVWTDMQLGPSGSPRPDVYTMQKSYSRPQPTAFEVKVSRSDLRADTTAGKWQAYLRFAGSVTFAVPDGLCTVADIPNGCGLIVRKAEVWRYARRATIHPVDLPMSAFMKLLIDGVARVSQRIEPRPRTVHTWEEHKAVRQKFGAAVDKAARDLLGVERRIAEMKDVERAEWDRVQRDVEVRKQVLMEQARKSVSEYEAVKRELCDWLGIEGEISAFGIRRKIAELKIASDSDARVDRAEQQLARARRAIEQAARDLAPPQEVAAA